MTVDLQKHLASVLKNSTVLHPKDLAAQNSVVKELETAIASGQTAASLLDQQSPISAALISDAVVEQQLKSASVVPASPLEKLVRVRTSPILAGDPVTAAAKPDSTQGPFLSPTGIPIWIDTFLIQQATSIYVSSALLLPPQLVAVIPISRAPTLQRPHLAAGSVWIPSRLFVHGRPENEFVGVKIQGGAFELDGTETPSANAVTLSGAWGIKLNLLLDPPANPTPSPGPGADVSNALVHLPTNLTISLSASGLQVSLTNGDATLYGDAVQLQRNTLPPIFDAISNSIVVPMDFAGALNFDRVRSDIWRISSASTIVSAGWSLPTFTSDPANLGTAASAGNFWFSFGSGFQVSWRGQTKNVPLSATVFLAAPDSFGFHAALIPAALTQSFALWTETPATAAIRSSVVFNSTSTSTLFYAATTSEETVIVSGAISANLDRPLRADGERLTIALPRAGLLIDETSAGVTALVTGLDATAIAAPHIAIALKNALFKIRPPNSFLVHGGLSDNGIVSGNVYLRFWLRSYLATLPDPYAANFDFDFEQDTDQGSATANISWADPTTPELSFAVATPPPAEVIDPSVGLPLGSDFGIELGGRQFLVDVSSAADQFGVMLPIPQSTITIDQLSITAPAQEVAIVTLPPISWEPMLTRMPTGGGDIPLPASPNDGGMALVSVISPQASALDPASLLADFNAALNKQTPFNAWLPLPFGLIAQLNFGPNDPHATAAPYFPVNSYTNVQPTFDPGLTGGAQLSFAGDPKSDPTVMDPAMPGKIVAPNRNYAIGVLSENIFTEFIADFGSNADPKLPLRRYDLSGYGASLRSDWRDPESLGPAIIHVNFDTHVGRTAHEVVQMQSFIYPHYARVVRTITMDRTAGGWILREDSGWIATSDGQFGFKADPNATVPAEGAAAFAPNQIHPGAIQSFTNIRNLQLQGDQFASPARGGGQPTIWQAVTFDAEILFQTAAPSRLEPGNGTSANLTTTSGASGWIQISGPTYETRSKNGTVYDPTRPANAQEIFDLLADRGNAQAPISCSLLLGGVANNPGLTLRAVRVEVGCNDNANTPDLVASVMGSPQLPRDGAWSVARQAAGDAAPSALNPDTPIPLVSPAAGLAGAGVWHLADALDILRLGDADTPQMLYGLVQSLGTQKVFFGRPRVNNDANPISFPKVPQLADMGALLTAAGIFPGLADSFDFGSLKSLAVNSGQVGFSDSFTIGAAGSLKSAVLADLGGSDGIELLINYCDEQGNPTQATITVNPEASPRWALELNRVSFAINYRGGPLISIFAKVSADDNSGPGVSNLVVKYESILSALDTIFSNIQQVARFLPGGLDAGLQIGFSQGRLSVKNDFSLPSLPLGAGEITDVSIQMGFDVAISPFSVEFTAGIGSEEHPFNWVVSPLSGNGFVQVGVTTDGLNIKVQAGLGLGLAIDLGIAAGSASIALSIELNTEANPFEIRGVLSGRANVDVLEGLASATITLAAGLGFVPPPQLFEPPFLPPQLIPLPTDIPPLTVGIMASVSVGIHLSVCWVADVDWDGYWQFTQYITTPDIPIPQL